MTPDAPSRAPRLLSGRYRLPTLGLMLVITLCAFEALAVATVLPVTARDLHGVDLYPWAFTSFLVASLVGMVDGGARSDTGGPGGVLVRGLAAFGAGLLVCSVAPSMAVFVLGRAVSGFGAGAVIVASYVVVARVYDESLRPRVFAAMSAAWVVPSLIGPALAGLVAEHAGWRWVFGGLLPLIATGGLLIAPVLRSLPSTDSVSNSDRSRVLSALALAIGISLLQAAGTHVTAFGVLLLVVGAALLLPPLHRLLPPGALRLGRGLPAVVALRGLLAGAFFGAEAFLPLLLVTVHGVRPSVAGLPLTVGAVGWSAASWAQGRRAADANPAPLLRAGFGLIVVGVGGLALLALPAVPVALAGLLWGMGGMGMGLAMPSLSVLLLALSPADEQGVNSAALQIADSAGGAICIAAAGAIVAGAVVAGLSRAGGIALADLAMAALAGCGAVLAGRVRGSASA